MPQLSLPTVTLCAAASVNVRATITALTHCLEQIDFAQCLLFTDQVELLDDERIRAVLIPRIDSAQAYSTFMLDCLGHHLETDHCLVVQWDGFVANPASWRDDFLSFDYIGAPWPQFTDGHEVGNGGFSLRSRKLLLACRDPEFVSSHPEDVAICRINRSLLETKHGIRFANKEVALSFAFERTLPSVSTFGFHGIFNIIRLFGPDRFWEVYRSLDNKSTAFVDYARLIWQLIDGPTGVGRAISLTRDALRTLFRGG